MLETKLERPSNVDLIAASSDDSWAAVDHLVPHSAGGVVRVVAGYYNGTDKPGRQLANFRGIDSRRKVT
jgi:hypothetical protein